MFGLAFLDFFVLDDPVVIFVKESEDLSQVLWLLLEELIEDVVFGPFYFLIIIKIISFEKLLLDFDFVELFQMFGV